MNALSLGPFAFAAPLALLALIALPILVWLIRASPPPPKPQSFPGAGLLVGLVSTEVTPHRTPWPIVLLRVLAAGLAILAFARPSYAPEPVNDRPGPTLLVIDDGWPAAPRWREVREQALSAINLAAAEQQNVHILLTANAEAGAIAVETALSTSDARARIEALSPSPWPVDRARALNLLQTSDITSKVSFGRVVWITDGVDDVIAPDMLLPVLADTAPANPDSSGPPASAAETADEAPLNPVSAETFAQVLVAIAPTEVVRAQTNGPLIITKVSGSADGLTATIARSSAGPEARVLVAAESADGRAIASAAATFPADSLSAEVSLPLPAAAAERVSRLRLRGVNSAGSVWLLDDSSVRRRVGIVESRSADQPLLTDAFYLRRALTPYADIVTGDLAQVIDAGAQAILLPDTGVLPSDEAGRMTAFLEDGGLLIRFAGPRLAAEADEFTPVTLRQAERALGGALEWAEPQPIAAYPANSPFFGLTPPPEARVRAQVLAEPAPDLAARTWASLGDGTPLVTADRRGTGLIVLFHITARPDWSDVPLTGQFVDLLRRSLAVGLSRGLGPNLAGKISLDAPLDGFGRLGKVNADLPSIEAGALQTGKIGPDLPPGLYRASQGRVALNAAAGVELVAMGALSGVRETDAAAPTAQRLDGGLFSVAAGLLMLDLLIALGLAGTLFPARALSAKVKSGAARALRSISVAGLGLAMLGFALTGAPAQAQTFFDGDSPIRRSDLSQDEQAALGLHFGYIRTGNASLDNTTKAGLEGLSLQLFRRTSVEPGEPHGLDLETSPLELYPFIYMAVDEGAASLSPKAASRLNAYLRSGGALLIDTREIAGPSRAKLETLMQGVDAPPLTMLDQSHVLTRAFYLLKAVPGRNGPAQVWLEAGQKAPVAAETEAGEGAGAGGPALTESARGDGVSGLFIGSGDWASAWAVDERGRALLPVEGGDKAREQTYRFGINLIMYVLTGNYKEDQVHLPALLERLGP